MALVGTELWGHVLGPKRLVLVLLLPLLAADSPQISVHGKWVLMGDGKPAPHDDFVRGLQTSGLAWDGRVLWSVGDQRSAFPGCLFAIDPQTARLQRPPIPLVAEEPRIRKQLDAWGRLDAEGIEVLARDEHRFVVLLEANAMAALVVRVNDSFAQGVVEAIWEFRFADGDEPEPWRNDSNFRFEGVAIDAEASHGYVAFERDKSGQPRLYQFDLARAPKSGIGNLPLEPLAFNEWKELGGKPRTLLNVNSLEFVRTPTGQPRLLVLCRDRELLFVLDPRSAELKGQVPLDLRSPEGEPIEWASPEGVAYDNRRGVVYVITDPDSTNGNWRLRSTPKATGLFAKYVPLLFELKLPPELLRSQESEGRSESGVGSSLLPLRDTSKYSLIDRMPVRVGLGH